MALFLTACASKVPLKDQNQKNIPSNMQGSSTNPDGNSITAVDVTNNQNNIIDSTPNPKTIYFDTDSYVVKPEFQNTLTKHNDYVVKNNSKILLQGHTDQRGTSEYNLALGQRRAEAVKKSLVILGTSPDRLETVSFGKEKPILDEANEEAYSKNRRTEIIYK